MTIRKDFLISAGAALLLALPFAAQAQADQAASPPAPDQPAAAPAAAASQSAAAAAAPAATADTSATKDYPRCSKTVTDNCVQSEGGSQGKARHGKSSHRKKT